MKFLLIAGFDMSLLNFRLPLIREIKATGATVVAAAPRETAGVPEKLADAGVRFVPIPLSRTGMNPLSDRRSYLALRRLCASERPDIVLSYTIKPVIYGSLAARAEGVLKVHALITGLGTAFHAGGVKGRLLRFAAETLYRRALRGCERVFVQNGEIAQMFLARQLAKPDQLVRVAGSGVDTDFFAPQPIPVKPMFLFLGRLLRDKGLVEFARASAEIRARNPDVRCRVVGATDSNPTGISEAEVAGWCKEGWIERYDQCEDVRPHLAECSVFVLPSYHEGMPRSVLEAMATGRAIVTTDSIGCRDTISVPSGSHPDRDGIILGDNGMLVPVGSTEALIAAMKRMLAEPLLVQRMGQCSREIALSKFDVRAVNRVMLDKMGMQLPAVKELGA